MKTVILLLCAVLIGFGYLLSDRRNAQSEIVQLRQQISQLQSTNRALQVQLTQTEQVRDELTQQNQSQVETIRQLELTIANQQKQIGDLEAKVKIMQTGSSIQESISNASGSGIFLPVIPAALATTYLVVRSYKQAPRKTKKFTYPRSTWVQLTDGELQNLIQLRRKQHQ